MALLDFRVALSALGHGFCPLSTAKVLSEAVGEGKFTPPRLVRNGLAQRPHFGVFLTDGEVPKGFRKVPFWTLLEPVEYGN